MKIRSNFVSVNVQRAKLLSRFLNIEAITQEKSAQILLGRRYGEIEIQASCAYYTNDAINR